MCVCRGLLDLEVHYGAIVQSLPTSNKCSLPSQRERFAVCVCVGGTQICMIETLRVLVYCIVYECPS